MDEITRNYIKNIEKITQKARARNLQGRGIFCPNKCDPMKLHKINMDLFFCEECNTGFKQNNSEESE